MTKRKSIVDRKQPSPRKLAERNLQRNAWDGWIRDTLKPNVAMTLTFNLHIGRPVDPIAANPRNYDPNVVIYRFSSRWAEKQVGKFLRAVEEFRSGDHFYDHPLFTRVECIAFTEMPEGNFHYHAALSVKTSRLGRTADDVMDFMRRTWKRLVPSGTIDVQPIMKWRHRVTGYDWVTYIQKDAARHDYPPIFAIDFAPHKQFDGYSIVKRAKLDELPSDAPDYMDLRATREITPARPIAHPKSSSLPH